MNRRRDIEISLTDHSIVLSDELSDLVRWLNRQSYSSYFLLTDENTAEHCYPMLRTAWRLGKPHLLMIPAGEEHKKLSTCERVWRDMLDQHADRSSLVINLGGGVVGDLGGFAASCYKRGVDFIQVPTTLLAQVDASIGGKLGVDFQYGKNLVGLFRNPRRVHICTTFLRTLPARELRSGFAEIFKHALIGDAGHWEQLKQAVSLEEVELLGTLERSLRVKKKVVEQDPLEQGLRKSLNFGHTIGHALETLSLSIGNDRLLHGEAVALGMIMETWLSVQKCGLPAVVLQDVTDLLLRHYPLFALPGNAADSVWEHMLLDKKNKRNKVLASLIREAGVPVWDVELTRGDLDKALEFYKSLGS